MKYITNPIPKDQYIYVKSEICPTHIMKWKIDGRIHMDGEELYVFYCDGTQFFCDPFELNNKRILERVEYICQKYGLICEKKLLTNP